MAAPSPRVRGQVLLRDGSQCVSCGARTSPLEMQHRQRVGMGGDKRRPEPHELATACSTCNRRFESDLQTRALACGWKVGGRDRAADSSPGRNEQMSVKVSSWVWHGDETATLSGNEMILMLALADVADDNGRCRFMTGDDDLTYAGLARKARVDRSTAIRVVGRLRQRGLVEQVKGSRMRPNEFAIVVPWNRGGELPPVGKVASATRKVASEAPKGGNADDHSSYRRIDVTDVSTSDVVDVLPTAENDVVRLSNLLAEKVRANGHKVGVVGQTWHAACDRLIRLDGYTPQQVEWMIGWATSDEFWAANIRSMPTLREKFSTLVAQAKRKAGKAQAPGERAASVIELGRRLQAEDEAAGRAS